MAERMLRRGLPRVPGGQPWPPADAVAEQAETVEPVAVVVAAAPVGSVAPAVSTDAPAVPEVADAAPAAVVSAGAAVRRGLPRTVGGEPWPPAASATGSTVSGSAPVAPLATAATAPAPAAPVASVGTSPTAVSPTSAGAPATAALATSPAAVAVRRGLPRTPDGDPWPPAETAPLVHAGSAGEAAPAEAAAIPADLVPASAAGAQAAAVVVADVATPLSWTPMVWNGTAPRRIPAPEPAGGIRRPTWTQAIAVLFGAAALGVLAAAAVAFVRTLLSVPFMQDFLTAFPGAYEPGIAVEPGFAPWIGWQHFFNVFLMVLIIRSGLTIRTEKRPSAFWTPRNNPKGKVSLTIWFHQSLDILWLVNGVIFIVLLFVTGHWVRIVPTSWEVLPNALSAALQYLSFDWPTEHGWVNYNSLQQLAYFVTVFIAAPLAAATGFRMSGMWPARAEKLSKAYPIEWARALHFPIMLYFVVFIIGHVALVFLTGFLRNLNHMFASSDAVTWTGFWVFVASLVVIAAGWAAARPLVLAPIAKLFGQVSAR